MTTAPAARSGKSRQIASLCWNRILNYRSDTASRPASRTWPRHGRDNASLLRPRRRHLRLAGADRLVDHLPDLLVKPVLLPDAVRGSQQHRWYRNQPNRPAHRRINPLMTPQVDAHLAFSGGDDHCQRIGNPQQLAPQALLARLHHRAVTAGAVNLCLELLRAEVICQRPGELVRRNGGDIDPLDVQRRPAGPPATALLVGHFRSLHSSLRIIGTA